MSEAPNVNELINKGYKREGDRLLSPTEKYPSYIGRDNKEWKNYNKHIVYLNSGGQPIREEYFIPYSNYMGDVTEYMKIGLQKRVTYDGQGFKIGYEEYERYKKSKREEALKLRLKQRFVNDYEAGTRQVETRDSPVEDVVNPYRTKQSYSEPAKVIKSIRLGEKNYGYTGKATESFVKKKEEELNKQITDSGNDQGNQVIAIGLERGGADKINKAFSRVGITNAQEYFNAFNKGTIKQEGDKFTMTTTSTKENKEFFGWSQKLTQEAKKFFDVARGDFSGLTANSKFEQEAIKFKPVNYMIRGAGAVAGSLTVVGAGVSGVVEQGLFFVNKQRPVISDINTTFEDSGRAQETYDNNLRDSQLLLGMSGAFITDIRLGTQGRPPKKLTPDEYNKVVAKFDKGFKTEPYKFSRQVMDEYGNLKGIQPADETLGLVKSKQVQTQIINKPVFDEKSIFAPEKYEPMSFSELAKQRPDVARELTRESGQQLLDLDVFSKMKPNEFKTNSRLRQVYDEIAIERAKARTEQFKPKDMLDIAKAQVEAGGKQTTIKEAQFKNLISEADRVRTISFTDTAGKTRSYFVTLNKKGQQGLLTQFGNVYERQKFGIESTKFTPELPDFTATGRGGLKVLPVNFLIKDLSPNLVDVKKNLFEPININAMTLKLEGISKARLNLNYESALREGQKSELILRLASSPVYKMSAVQITQPKFSTENLLITDTAQDTKITPIFKFPNQITTPKYETRIPEPKYKFLGFPSIKSEPKNLFQGYDVFLRRGGKFNKINFAGALPKSEAMNLGIFTADTTAGASFKILPSKDLTKGSFSGGGDINKFYKSKREAGVFIEKSKFRISTPGEKTEITLKGIYSSKGTKRKKKKRGIFDFR